MHLRTVFIALLLIVTNIAVCTAANDQLVAEIKKLGKAVDDMSANISTATNDSDAQMLANVTRQALDNGLKQDRPTITITASASYCKVLIHTPKWRLWSEARAGKIIDHGATIH
jgi:hypothetical protein